MHRSNSLRAAQTLLHSRQKVAHDDAECADLVGKFSQFFVDKVRRIRDCITSALVLYCIVLYCKQSGKIHIVNPEKEKGKAAVGRNCRKGRI